MINLKDFLLTSILIAGVSWNNGAISSNYCTEITQHSDKIELKNSLQKEHSLLNNNEISCKDNDKDISYLKDNKGKKTDEYYRQRTTEIGYNNNIKIVVNPDKENKGREENIEVYVNSEKYKFNSHSARHILSMNQSFHDFADQALESLSNIINKNNSKESSTIILSKYIEYKESLSNTEQNDNASRILKSFISEIKNEYINVKKIIVPIRQGKHWLTVVINFNDTVDKATVNVINSTNQIQIMSLQSIKGEYREFLIPIIERSLNDLGITLDSDFGFSQYLQYGNMGCGITMSLFIEDLLKDKFKLSEDEIFLESDYSNGNLIKDKSGRSSLVLEAIRRVQLAFEIEKSDGFKVPVSSLWQTKS